MFDRYLKITLLVVLFPYLALSLFAHPQADDFLFGSFHRRYGIIGTVKYLYWSHSGRYSSTALTTFLINSNLRDYCCIFPIAIIILIFLSVWKFSILFLDRTNSLWCSVLFCCLILTGMPSLPEGIYWVTSVCSYALGMCLIFLLLSLLIENYRIAAILGFIIAGFNESAAIILVGMILIGIVFYDRKWHLTLFATCIGVLISFSAPGNQLRCQAQFSYHHPNLLMDGIKALIGAIQLIGSWVDVKLLSATLLFGSIVPRIKFKNYHSFAIPCSWFIILFAALFPTFHMGNVFPPMRVINVLFITFLCGWLHSVVVLMNIFPPKISDYAICIARTVLSVGLIFSMILPAGIDLLYFAPKFHASMERRYQIIAEAKKRGDKIVKVPNVYLGARHTVFVYDAVDRGPHGEGQLDAADFFGVPEIQTESEGKYAYWLKVIDF